MVIRADDIGHSIVSSIATFGAIRGDDSTEPLPDRYMKHLDEARAHGEE